MCKDCDEKLILEGWARLAEEYEPRPLSIVEQHQVERAVLNEEIAKRTPFVLGQPIHA